MNDKTSNNIGLALAIVCTFLLAALLVTILESDSCLKTGTESDWYTNALNSISLHPSGDVVTP